MYCMRLLLLFSWKVVALANDRFLCCSHYFVIATCMLIRIDHLPLGKLYKRLFHSTISARHHFCLYTYRFDKGKEKMRCERMKKILNITKERKRLLIKFTSRGKWQNLIENMLRWRNKANGITNYRLPEQCFLLISMTNNWQIIYFWIRFNWKSLKQFYSHVTYHSIILTRDFL